MRGAGGGLLAVAGGGDGAQLERELRAAAGRGAAGVLSFGLAGALAPGLGVGDWVVGEGLHAGPDCDLPWVRALAAIFPRSPILSGVGEGDRPDGGGAAQGVEGGPGAKSAPVSSSTALRAVPPADRRLARIWADGSLAATAEAKRQLHARTGALATDMESHIAARVAADHGLPFAILRVISDSAADALPPAFAVAMQPGGGTDYAALIASLATRPGQLPAFVRAARHAMTALRALLRGRVLLGPRFLLPDAGERAADVI